MDERAEIWIARDPDTQAESKPVSLRKLQKGLRIGRLKPTMLVTRVGSTEWIPLDQFLAVVEQATPAPPAVKAPSVPPPPPIPAEASVEIAPEPRAQTPTVPPARAAADLSGEYGSLTARWFAEPPPDPDDDEPIFVSQSLLDLSFERVMSTKLVKLTYVLVLAMLAMAVLASFVRVGAAIASGSGQQLATAIAVVPVVVLACAVVAALVRMALEVLLALFRIADKLSRLAER